MSNNIGDILVEAINDEYRARATYRRVIETFGEIRPFVNIVDAESRHIEALLPLLARYGVEVPEDDWGSRIESPRSVQDACQAGVEAEIENGSMYARMLDSVTDYPDIARCLCMLRRASLENHLPAFQRCVERGARQGSKAAAAAPDGGLNTRVHEPRRDTYA